MYQHDGHLFHSDMKSRVPSGLVTVHRRSTILHTFAKSILAKGRAVRSGAASEKQRKRLRESISDDLRKCSDLLPHYASAAAVRKACKIGVDLFKQDWHTQTRFDPKRRIFLLEHFEPVAAIRDRCLVCNTTSAVVKILSKHLKIVWLLREEDERLNHLGFRTVRPDPASAYRQAGIQIVSNRRRSGRELVS